MAPGPSSAHAWSTGNPGRGWWLLEGGVQRGSAPPPTHPTPSCLKLRGFSRETGVSLRGGSDSQLSPLEIGFLSLRLVRGFPRCAAALLQQHGALRRAARGLAGQTPRPLIPEEAGAGADPGRKLRVSVSARQTDSAPPKKPEERQVSFVCCGPSPSLHPPPRPGPMTVAAGQRASVFTKTSTPPPLPPTMSFT